MFRLLPLVAFVFFLSADSLRLPDVFNTGITFHMRHQNIRLNQPMRGGSGRFFPRGRFTDQQLDTMSNWFSVESKYVEFIRQDHALHPTMGMALGFEFDENIGEYPYLPVYARLQLKDFGWGGVEFGPTDTCNYTGLTNEVSNDFTVEIDSFLNDTIYGRFNGLLLSGAGKMMAVDSGIFKVGLYRVQ